MGLPSIEINFTASAASLIERSARGIVVVIVQDDTDQTFDFKECLTTADVTEEHYTAENFAAINRALLSAPAKVIVVRIDVAETITDATAVLDTLTYNWVCAVPAVLQDGLASYVKTKNTASKNKKVMAIVAATTAPDSMYVVDVKNTAVTEGGASVGITAYIPRLAALQAGASLTTSATYQVLADITAASAIADPDAVIDVGGYCLINDDGEVRVGRAVTSLTTLSTGITDDMKKIVIVEAMNMIREDIGNVFKQSYVGKYKNNTDNQSLFVAAVNTYFRGLAASEVLDDQFDNTAGIDVAAQRTAWVDAGTVEAEAWDDAKVKKMTFRSIMFLAGSVKILDAIEDLTFDINMA